LSNYINFSNRDLNKFIYRIISIDRLNELFVNNENVLVKPSLWEDPFENFILKSKVRLVSGETASFDFKNDFYGQCWSFHKASDAMWRIYSYDKYSVRIRTTVKKLLTSLEKSLGEWAHTQSFIGRVNYLPNKMLIHFANTVFKGINIPSADLFAKTLLVKRPAFKHENEIRLLYFEKNNGITEKLYRYPINSHEFIDQIMIDPRLSESEANTVKNNIISSTGFKGSIKRSLLYATPKNMVFPFG
jgi:Protein of unknown function (DUF2971)